MSIDKQNLGPILIVFGLVLFLGNLGIFHLGSFFAAIVLATIGMLFFKNYKKNKKHLWSFLMAFGFFAVATSIINPAMAGTSLFVVLALGFMMVYRNNGKHWWAIIPAGSLLSLAAVTASEERFTIFSGFSEELFFLGLAATFAYLFFNESKKWAIYPAVALASIPLLGAFFSGGWLLPILLIAIGLYMHKTKNSGQFFNKSNH